MLLLCIDHDKLKMTMFYQIITSNIKEQAYFAIILIKNGPFYICTTHMRARDA